MKEHLQNICYSTNVNYCQDSFEIHTGFIRCLYNISSWRHHYFWILQSDEINEDNISKWLSSVEVFPLVVTVEITWRVSNGKCSNGKENNQTKKNFKNTLWIVEKMLTSVFFFFFKDYPVGFLKIKLHSVFENKKEKFLLLYDLSGNDG